MVEKFTEMIELGKAIDKKDDVKKLEAELEEIEKKYDNFSEIIQKRAEESISGGSTKGAVSLPLPKRTLEHFKAVSIPVFNGNIKDYSDWRTLLKVYIEEAAASSEEKLLQLRQYVSGEPERLIKGIGFRRGCF